MLIDIPPLITVWVAGSSPAGPTSKSTTYRIFISSAVGITAPETPRFVARCDTSQSANYRSTLALAIVSPPVS